ncbi:hypothetical protein KSP40_PGU009783 [Platanthera guangdongensis]|uniref:NmrA-like domain-containing protein n=1 Tax=Platanthera guangdongensis TaxID=2320717 RepID=A0ABR2LEF6_9ASPA
MSEMFAGGNRIHLSGRFKVSRRWRSKASKQARKKSEGRELKVMASEKNRILIIGGTGYIGKFIVKASARAGHPTFSLIRESTAADHAKAKILEEFKDAGVTLVHGDLYDHESLVKTLKKVDVVISAVGQGQIADQTKIIAAMKEAGNIKRFFPSEFGNDVDRTTALEPAKLALGTKIHIRRAIEAENIPYTYVSSYFFAGYYLPSLAQATTQSLPTDKQSSTMRMTLAHTPLKLWMILEPSTRPCT